MPAKYSLSKTVICTLDVAQSQSSTTEYVYDIVSSPDGIGSIISSSDNKIRCMNNSSNIITSTLNGHNDTISGLEFISHSEFFSASHDKTTLLWDTRTSNIQSTMYCNDEVSNIAVGMNNNLLAMSCETSIYFYDIRKLDKSLGEYSDSHTDTIAQLQFSPNPNQPYLLASAADDGLIVTYNVAQQAHEEAVVSIMNCECPVRKFGFFGSQYEGIYSLTTVEHALFWHHTSAQRLSSFDNIRENIGVDYLVDCISSTTGQLHLVAGNHDGNAVLCNVQPSSVDRVSTIQGARGTGHSSTIRCISSSNTTSQTSTQINGNGLPSRILTGAEDAKVCIWDLTDLTHDYNGDSGSDSIANLQKDSSVFTHDNNPIHNNNNNNNNNNNSSSKSKAGGRKSKHRHNSRHQPY